MPRKSSALVVSRLGTRRGGDVLEHHVDDEPRCLLCTLVDNDEDEPLRDRLARMLAYGALVFAADGGVATCGECHDAIRGELRDLRRELRNR